MANLVSATGVAVAAAVAIIGYIWNSASARRIERATRYAEALREVERYRQLPSVFYRRHDGSVPVRAELSQMLSEVQVGIAFHRRWLNLESPRVGVTYGRLVDKIRERNSQFRKDALSQPQTTNDLDIELGDRYKYDESAELEACLRAMRRELALVRNL